MEKDYKIEMKPTLWSVSLESGCYSDWSIDYYFFKGNSIEEVWNFVCRYFEDVYNVKEYNGHNSLYFEDEDKKYIIQKWANDETRWDFKDKKAEDINFDTDYGDTKLVRIRRLDVIYFEK